MTKAITSTTSAGAGGGFSGQLVGIGKAQLSVQKDMSRLLSRITLQLAKGAQLAAMNKQMQAVNKIQNQQQNIMKGMNALGPGRGSGGAGSTNSSWFSKITDFFKDLPGKIMSGIKGGMKIMSKIWEKTGGALFKKTGESGMNKLLGLGGVSIIGALVGKMIASSPLLQAMFKIMNTSLTLILRPIGDFFGAFLRPMSIYFLKEIAIPFFKQGKGWMKEGEKWGRIAVGFFVDPIQTIVSGVTLAGDSILKSLNLRSSLEEPKPGSQVAIAQWFQDDPAEWLRWKHGMLDPETDQTQLDPWGREYGDQLATFIGSMGLQDGEYHGLATSADPLSDVPGQPLDVTVVNPDEIGGDTITIVTQGGITKTYTTLPGLGTPFDPTNSPYAPEGALTEYPYQKDYDEWQREGGNKPPKKDFWGDAWNDTIKFFADFPLIIGALSTLTPDAQGMEEDFGETADNIEYTKEQSEKIVQWNEEAVGYHEQAASMLEQMSMGTEHTMSKVDLINYRTASKYGRSSEHLVKGSDDIVIAVHAMKKAYESIAKDVDNFEHFTNLESTARKLNSDLQLNMTEDQLDFNTINRSKIASAISIWDTVLVDMVKWQIANSHTQNTMFNAMSSTANDFIMALTGEAGTVGTIDMSSYGSGTTASNIMTGTGANNPLLAMQQKYTADYGGVSPGVGLKDTPFGQVATMAGTLQQFNPDTGEMQTNVSEFSTWQGPDGHIVTTYSQVPKATRPDGTVGPAAGWTQVANTQGAMNTGIAWMQQAQGAIANATQSAHISSYLSASKSFSQAQSVAYVQAGGGAAGMEAAIAQGEADAAAEAAAAEAGGGGGDFSHASMMAGTHSGGYSNPSAISYSAQFGGIIDEPILGVGLHSGKEWSLGESGKELVTPVGDLNQGGGVNILNINVGSITKEADYQKLKPYVQRWILESSSRRGTV
jgi:hypothetical protein